MRILVDQFFPFKTIFFSQPKTSLINLGINIKTLVNQNEERPFSVASVNQCWIDLLLLSVQVFYVSFFSVLPLIFISVGLIPLYYCFSYQCTIFRMFFIVTVVYSSVFVCYLVVRYKIYLLRIICIICALFYLFVVLSIYPG